MSDTQEGASATVSIARAGKAPGDSLLRRSGAWVGLLIGVLGLLLIAAVIATGGGYFLVVPTLTFMVPLTVAGLVAAAAALTVDGRPMSAVAWLGVVVIAGIAWNIWIYAHEFGRSVWKLLVPLTHPAGVDFRDGLYNPARAFTTVHSGWPPLTLVLGKPFALLDLTAGYHVQVVLLIGLAEIASLFSAELAVRTVTRASAAGTHSRRPSQPALVATVWAAWLFTSYGFFLELDRGNIDLYALVFALLALWCTVRGTRSPWPAASALAVATGLKLYPAILVVVLLWRYRRKALLPFVLTTAGVLLIAGPTNLVHTFTTLHALSDNKAAGWWGEDSATAMAHVLRARTSWAPSWVFWPLIGAPSALWVITLGALVRDRFNERGAVLLGAACVPMMAIVPPVSNDYKLVLCVLPLAVLSTTVATARRAPGIAWVAQFSLLSLATMLLARSTQVIGPSLQGSKYVLLVLLQVLLLVVVLVDRRGKADVAAATVETGR